MRSWLQQLLGVGPRVQPWNSDRLIREELLSIERLEQCARELAVQQTVTLSPPRRETLSARLVANDAMLLSAYRSIAGAVAADNAITPAAEWLIDNYHLVEEQIRQVKDDLSPRFYRQLPKLAAGPLAGYPRVFGIAWTYVAHSDSHFDKESLQRFVRAYQQIQPLTIGELWAAAITLRIVLVENLRRAAERIVSSRSARERADLVADRLLGVNGYDANPGSLASTRIGDASQSAAFVVQLLKRLRDQDPRVTPALQALEQQLQSRGTSCDELVRDEHQRQGASNVTVRNIITSMRLISDVNWSELFEQISLVDDVLRGGSEFADMDFATRNLYRSAIEELARGSRHSEVDIARAVLMAARRDGDRDAHASDPGYHLLSNGRRAFEVELGYRPPLRHWLSRSNTRLGPRGYITAVQLLAALVLAAPLLYLHWQQLPGWQLLVLGLLGVVPAVDLAVAYVNRAASALFGATSLPALSLRDGVPAPLRTLVAVPTLLTTPAAVVAQIERLEVHYLASAQGEIYYALLSDWTDSSTENTDEDESLYAVANDGIASLNRTHPSSTGYPRFWLLHRHRLWNPGQQQWMGWERKRGKLHELNQLLRGATTTSFNRTGCPPPVVPPAVRYVITLDADTRLPRGTVQRLIGKLAHPLNQPCFDNVSGRVTEGYAVLQPRVTPSLPIGREGSLYQRVYSNMSGIDPYDAAVSDVYQDLFGEGSYAGKGIYDVDAFEAALVNRVPENSLLSHDLFEGSFARAGLVSDIEVVEEYPSRYDVAAARNHRWARGDWQLLPWIFGRRDVARRGTGPLPLLARWKMLDNLRRTLSAPTTVLALVAGWLLPRNAALLWTGFLLATIALPNFLPLLAAILPRRRTVTYRSYWRALSHDCARSALQIVFSVTFLGHQAWLMTDAIGRTLFRLSMSRRNLLEWVTNAQAQGSTRLGAIAVYRHMSSSIIVAITALTASLALGAQAWWLAVPFVALWLAAPAVARQISISPLVAGRVAVTATDALSLRLVARRTWRYFEQFVTAHDHMLPPDNFQEDPLPVIAHRTSPTNIGLYLLSTVSARDFGWIGTLEALERLEATFAAMAQLESFRGHFYNWYDTGDLRPLEPRYVSSVDSGNLAAHLIVVANAAREWVTSPVTTAASIAGVQDALQLMRQHLADLPASSRTQVISHRQLLDALNALSARLKAPQGDYAAQIPELASRSHVLADGARALGNEHPGEAETGSEDEMIYWAEAAHRCAQSWQRDSVQGPAAEPALRSRLLRIEHTARTLAYGMKFDFLLNTERRLLSIGFLVADGVLDPSCYDLLASEARLASFFAIAKNDVPARHWFRLGRAATPIERGAALISWSGSMFEYLMPSLVMRAPAGSLLEQTNHLIVRRQISYGNELGVPWGISESAYSARDLELTYQYSNFGVPGLGYKRGLSDNLVIAPYATGLAAMVDPESAARNFAQLAELGALGHYGFYEALDYTSTRLPAGVARVVVRAHMAHHQGMTVVAIANVLFNGLMRERFHAESSIQATELLLQERTPRDVAIARPRAEEVGGSARLGDLQHSDVRRLHTTHTATPQTHLLSNGRLAVMLTGAGSGYLRWRELAVTRWREDVTRDDFGSYIFLRDVADGRIWSATFQPSGVEPDSYEVSFTEDRAEFVRCDRNITTQLQVLISPEDDAEVRRFSITNSGSDVRDLDVTSYCELALAAGAADTAHPAFSKLFVQTEFLPKLGALLATRRRRAPEEPEIWAAHHVVVEGEVLGRVQYETDRARFLGRGREVHTPMAVTDGRPLSNTVGTVLDPIFALRHRVRIAPGATVRLCYWTEVAASRTEVLDQFDKHHDANAFVRAATLAWTQAQVQMRHLGVSAEEANFFQQLAAHVLYANASLRPTAATIANGSGTPIALWAQGISGDLPIVLLRVSELEELPVVRQLLRAHEYWRLKNLAVDVVILNERASSYVQDLQTALDTVLRTSQSRSPIGTTDASGRVIMLRSDIIAAETRAILSSVARVVFIGQRGSLDQQLDRRMELPDVAAGAHRALIAELPVSDLPTVGDLEFYNGLGGFANDGREYVTCLSAGQSTPAPWINVVANPGFGFQVAVEGGGYTWAINSREHQLTPWSNDPVTDRPGEVLYVRDDDSGAVWGPTAAPIRSAVGTYCARHGQGYSRFTHRAHDIELELLMFVPLQDPVKICRLTIRNRSQHRRRLSVTAYVEWVLGNNRATNAPCIITEIDAATGAMLARNPWSTSFGSRVAFADLAGRQTEWTADRREFLGVLGTLESPAALARDSVLSGRVGPALDPCCALRAPFTLEPGKSTDMVFLLGETASASEARALLERYRVADLDAVLLAVTGHWDNMLGVVQVKTPDRALDIMLNRWLLYQTLACRMWARSAFYQASGAYGFRDQLQDSMALVTALPLTAREHLLRAAGRQFPEGDVQHWWLPPEGRGVRTHISDDRIWLSHAAAHYLATTGDATLLNESVSFIEGPKLQHGEHDAFFLPATAEVSASFYEHCARGLDASLAVGAHGLPLIGTGDWNDGMNRVGAQGRGESVWLGWFLAATLRSFASIAVRQADQERATRWLAHAELLRAALENEAWDGGWYRRGYYDDGSPLGSASNDECRIDSIAQSWSVISALGEPARASAAMAAVDAQLLNRAVALAQLFTPPFDRTAQDPGYVKGYPPGIRENGGQYSHAAAWSVIAFAKLGQGDKAAQLYSLLNPINHSNSRTGLRRYKVEPYVMAADVYAAPQHIGRGGWTWYTGAAGWMYQAGLEAMLGFRKQGNLLLLSPCIPVAWPAYEISFRFASSRYEIRVRNPDSVSSGVVLALLDGVPLATTGSISVPLADDGATHSLAITLGRRH
jgi:cyclic beta-1,2-glucan synthetase